MGKREITIKNGVISNGKVDIPINEIRRVVCASNGTISKLLIYKEEKPSSFFKKIFDKCDENYVECHYVAFVGSYRNT